MKELKLRFVGKTPLLLHSDKGADPLNEETKAHKVLTSKRLKTDEDNLAIAESEYKLGMHHDEKIGPYFPALGVLACIINGAKLSKKGAAFQRGVITLQDKAKLEYKGPRGKDELWKAGKEWVDSRTVVVKGNRIVRYRPKFNQWQLVVKLEYDPAMIEESDIIKAAQDAGAYVGLGDFRPQKKGIFGRFDVEKEK